MPYTLPDIPTTIHGDPSSVYTAIQLHTQALAAAVLAAFDPSLDPAGDDACDTGIDTLGIPKEGE